MTDRDIVCAECGSGQVQKVSSVFEHELALANANATGDTPALLRVAPPVHRNVDKSISLIAVFGVIGIAWHILWPGAVIFLALAIRDAAWNNSVWPKLYAYWEASYLCGRCDFLGPPAAAAPLENPV